MRTTDDAVTDPATGEVVATYPTATGADIESALARAAGAQRGWARFSTVTERAARVRRAAELHRERRDELAAVTVLGMDVRSESRMSVPSIGQV